MKTFKTLLPFAALLMLIIVFHMRIRPAFAQGGTPQVIALDEPSYSGTSFTLRVAFWYPITKQVTPLAGGPGSQWLASGSSAGATPAQVAAINTGTIKEEVEVMGPWSIGTPISAIQAELQQHWITRNGQLNGQGANQYYGNYWNGTAWSFQ